MKRRALLLACLLALPGWAAGPLDALRANSRSAREQMSTARAEQLKQRSALSELSTRIERLKVASKGKLLPGGELDAALKDSQDLSGILSRLAQDAASKEVALETANLALLDALSAELNRLRAEFDRQTDRAVRKSLISQLRSLRAERETLRQTLPAARLPTLDTVRPSDDPEELLEQADLLRDNEEKLRRELKSLEARIAERREEAELDRRVQRFMGEESMFDDSDRRLRVQRTTSSPSEAMPPVTLPGSQNAESAKDSVTDTAGSGAPGLGSVTTASEFGFPAPRAAAPGEEPGRFNGVDPAGIRVTNASDARVQVGGGTRALTGGDDDLDDLEVERVRLQGLAAQLKKKADELQQRAAELK